MPLSPPLASATWTVVLTNALSMPLSPRSSYDTCLRVLGAGSAKMICCDPVAIATEITLFAATLSLLFERPLI